MEALDIDKITEVYLRMRDKKAEHADSIKAIEQQMELLEHALLGQLKAQNVKSLGTKHATVVYKLHQRFFSTDWPAFRQWARANDAVDLFESRLHQGNTEEWVNDHPDLVPPGLQVDSKEKVTVTRK